MKFSTSLVLVLACACAMVVANPPRVNAKNHSRKAIETQHKERSAKQNNEVVESVNLRSIIDSGVDTLTKAIDVLTPLARDSAALYTDLVARVWNGGANSKEGRANDANLLARIDNVVNDASSAYKALVSSKIASRVSRRAASIRAIYQNIKAKVASAYAPYGPV